MKKATAFLTLMFLIALVFLFIYVNNDQCYPTWKDLEPATSLVKSFISEQWQKPILGGLIVFWVSAFILSLMVLREPSEDNSAELSSLKNEVASLQENLNGSKLEVEKLSSSLSEKQAGNEALVSELDKLKNGSVSTDVVEDLKTRMADKDNEQASLKAEIEKSQLELKSCGTEKTRLAAENEALLAKVEKIDQELKIARKESDRFASQAKTVQSELEKRQEELVDLKKQVETLNADLKSAQANIKGGKEAIPPAAYQILYLFQKEGRLIDLLAEDISELDDETLGGAIRPIHEGCRKLLEDRLIIEHVLNEEEGSEVTVDEIDPEAIKLSGRVPSKGPYTGELIHRGWRLKECNLPELVDGWKGNVIAPAEIEIS